MNAEDILNIISENAKQGVDADTTAYCIVQKTLDAIRSEIDDAIAGATSNADYEGLRRLNAHWADINDTYNARIIEAQRAAGIED